MAQVKCKKCGKEFGSEHGLKVHVGREHGSKPKAKRGRKKAPQAAGTICKICGRSFKLPLHLGRHMAASHGKAGKARKGKRSRRMAAARAPRAVRAPRGGLGVDVSSLTVDQLLGLKTAIDARLSDIARRMKQARVGA